MTENQAEQLFTATVEFRRPGAQQWEVSAQAADTLDGLVDYWAATASAQLQRPVPPLSAEALRRVHHAPASTPQPKLADQPRHKR